MKATIADPGVIGRETEDPAYWVVFRRGDATEEFRLTDVLSVHEVVVWAELKAAGRTFQILVEVDDKDDDGEGRHVVRLLGGGPAHG